MTTPVNPRPFLASLVGKNVVVKLKWGMEYTGNLKCADAYMNLQMAHVEEFLDGKKTGELKELLIRCNNVLFVRVQKQEAEKSSTTAAEAMEEGAGGDDTEEDTGDKD